MSINTSVTETSTQVSSVGFDSSSAAPTFAPFAFDQHLQPSQTMLEASSNADPSTLFIESDPLSIPSTDERPFQGSHLQFPSSNQSSKRTVTLAPVYPKPSPFPPELDRVLAAEIISTLTVPPIRIYPSQLSRIPVLDEVLVHKFPTEYTSHRLASAHAFPPTKDSWTLARTIHHGLTSIQYSSETGGFWIDRARYGSNTSIWSAQTHPVLPKLVFLSWLSGNVEEGGEVICGNVEGTMVGRIIKASTFVFQPSSVDTGRPRRAVGTTQAPIAGYKGDELQVEMTKDVKAEGPEQDLKQACLIQIEASPYLGWAP